eukprot:NODE_171_length_16024_cov_0.172559.p5 type:complete len:358 gc:universal NODE_171_length_16024_cov_0.172559:6814-5741(-)
MRSFLIRNYGYANYQYFQFLSRIILSCIIIGSLGFVSQVPHYYSTPSTINSLVISSYYVSEKLYLALGGVMQMSVIVVIGMNARYDRLQVYPELVNTRKQTLLNNIPNKHHGKYLKSIKRFVSGIVFFMIAIGILVVSFLIGTIPKSISAQTVTLAAFVSFIHYLSGSLCYLLSSFEEHKTWSSFRKNYFIKLLILRIGSTTASFIGISFISYINSNNIDCTIPNYGFILVLLSYAIKYLNLTLLHCLSKLALAKKPELDIADEFCDIIHKAFIVFSTSYGFPLIGIFVAFLAALHYVSLIISLKYVFKPPLRPTQSLMPAVNNALSYVCFVSLISSRMAFFPAIIQVSFYDKCLLG